MIRLGLLLLVPVAPLLRYWWHPAPIWIFIAAIVGVAILADWIRAATEELAAHVGPAIGGLLTVSLGSVAELLLALFVLMRGDADVVHAQITGSILGTSLLGLGVAVVVGSIGRERQHFKRERAGLLSSLLILVLIALLLPAVSDYTGRRSGQSTGLVGRDEMLSLAISVVLLLIYVANLCYTLITHRDVFASGERERSPSWSVGRSLAVLVAATIGAALESELLSGALRQAASALHLTPIFLGVIVIALVGTASDLFSAVWFARQNRMGLVMSICIGSAIQVALVVAPLLVILSWLLGRPMNLVFEDPLDLFAIASTALIVNAIAGDGETTWFEGVLLVGVYVVFGLAFFFV